ncbi:uncharacterized protein N7500_004111 [Penicillium coprophilum]|uniref:uncharacterized protein n=1 Tax=Penicillium coprophilum TaxID=36646 RepID=UPI00238790E9|nr:uncharacterized protein N7500_004111 [Penicillium coprophilum]KAJ5171328.1 hypothetical protein N7500_004111 [Penicillium coprophilum]
MSHTLRSGAVYNTPPPRRPRVQGPNVIHNRDYIVSNHSDIPLGLVRKKVASCRLEFLDVGPIDEEDPNDPNRNNHTILRLTFLRQLGDDTPYAPIGTRGVILDLEGMEALNGTNTSILMMSTFGYEGLHQLALHSVEVPMGRDKSVWDCVRIIRSTGLVPCHLDPTNTELVGCRDFVSQLIYQLNEHRFLRLPANANTTIFNHFNYRYNWIDGSAGSNKVLSSVAYALFRQSYQHVMIGGITYTGTRQFIQ